MANDKQKFEPKKGLPGGFFLFLLGAILIILTIQSFMGEKTAKVSFSYQLEHLVNLDLIQPDESRKIALGDNLVTFIGKFRDATTEEGKNRYDYLSFLNKNYELKANEDRLGGELLRQQKQVKNAATYFLQISGLPIPKSGYVVIDGSFDTSYKQNSIVITEVPNKGVISVIELSQNMHKMTPEALGVALGNLLQSFKSQSLGIGSEAIKQKLRDADALLDTAVSSTDKVAIYSSVLQQLQQIVQDLNVEQKGGHLAALRSVRNYLATLDSLHKAANDYAANQILLDKARQKVSGVVWFFNNQELSTRALEKQDPEAFHQWYLQARSEWEGFAQNRGLPFKAPDQPRNIVLEKKFKSQEPSVNYMGYVLTFLPALLVVFLLWFVFSRQMKGVGSTAMNFGKSPARLLTKEQNKVTFKDVAGAEEAKEELKEIVDFLKDPTKFTALGARIPKGVLLVGPPGTGKTLIAKAVAGEANRPFFSISGSDFVEMFVGVGASRIRDLFDQAKKNAPCIIFMDEIDAVGRHRGAGIGGGHDEREQTLNQLLVEMDGFDTREGVILMAATNRPDILDRALLRPGRFDRRVMLDLPDVKGRFEILKVHARRIKIDPSVDLMDIAKMTPGASGADLENILNEAALLAARRGRSAVTASEAKESCDKVRFGKERRSLEMDAYEKKTTAYHESGHAIVGLIVKNADPVDKVTIIPRGMSLGATHFMPKKNRLGYWKKEAMDLLAVLMGGRAAEEIFVQDMSSGAQQDISQATRLARNMVCEWGMSEDLGLVSYDERSESGQYLGLTNYSEKSYSEETAKKIDQEIYKLLAEAHKRALEIVQENKDRVQLMADMLIEFETLDSADIKDIMEGTWSIAKKRAKLKAEDELQRKSPPPPPLPVKPLSSSPDTPPPHPA